MDTTVENSMNVHVSDHHILKFKQCGDGLHFLDTSTLGNSVFPSNSAVNGYSYLQTVTSHKRYFTCREVQGANAACNLQQLLWWPSEKTFHKAVVSPYRTFSTATSHQMTSTEQRQYTSLHYLLSKERWSIQDLNSTNLSLEWTYLHQS